MLGPQSDRCKNLDGMTRNRRELAFLLNHGKQKSGFHHREGRSNANPRPATEGEIRTSRDFTGAHGILSPTLRIESFRVREETRIPLRAPLQDEDVRPRRDAVAPQ